MIALAVLLFSLLAYSNAYITELTDDNFLNYASNKDVLLVNFYAPWCSDCKRLEPEFERTSSVLGARSLDLAKVDCFGAGKGLCELYSVKSWPQLKNFNKGTYTGDYNGAQSAEAMAGYITTVEDSILPQQPQSGNPYAMANNKPSSPVIAPAPPVVGDISCAKCNIQKVAGKISKHCSDSVKKACVELKERQTNKHAEYDDDDKKRTLH